jgi:hypothetical protein
MLGRLLQRWRHRLLGSPDPRRVDTTPADRQPPAGVPTAVGSPPADEPVAPPPRSAREVSSPPAVAPGAGSRLTVHSRDAGWIVAEWHLADGDLEAVMGRGGGRLQLRVCDAGVSERSGPGAVRMLEVDPHAGSWFLPVPLAGRTYRITMGYSEAGVWRRLGEECTIAVPTEQAEWHGGSPDTGLLEFPLPPATLVRSAAAPPAASPVQHEHLYRAAVSAPARRVGSEGFLRSAGDVSAVPGEAQGRDSGAGLWASGRQESGAGPARSRDFWLVADAELIVYGATDPHATVTIGNEEVRLDADGTFRRHVPFPDGLQVYPIEALAQDGEQRRHITMRFERSTPTRRTNASDERIPEWF